MKDKLKKCATCVYFNCVNEDGNFLEKGYCLIQDLYTFVEDDDVCDEYILDKGVEKDIEAGLWQF